MLKKYFLLLLCAFASNFAFANNIIEPSIQPNQLNSLGPGCNEPAPLNFHVEDAAQNWVRLRWHPIVPGAFKHRVKTYIDAGNILISDILVPASENSLVVAVPVGEPCHSTINTVCEDGSNSIYIVTVFHPDIFVTDLIVSGVTPPSNNFDCTISTSGEKCGFSVAENAETFFRIQRVDNSNDSRPFKAFKAPSITTLRTGMSTLGGDYTFKIDGIEPKPPKSAPGYVFQIWHNVPPSNELTIISTFVLYYHFDDALQPSGQLECTFIDTNYQIIRLVNPPPTHFQQGSTSLQEEGEDREAYQIDIPKFSAFPNPFTESLEIYLGPKNQVPVHLQLLNLNGQIVQEQHDITDQEFVTLSTASLSPGFYMLRIEADGQVQTLKVVKSE